MAISNHVIFAAVCDILTREQIQHLFDNDTPSHVRDSILRMARDDGKDPMRSAFHRLGEMYNIDSLKTY